MQKRYRALRMIAILQKILALLTAGGALIGALILLGGGAMSASQLAAVPEPTPTPQPLLPDILGTQETMDTFREIRTTVLTVKMVSQMVGGILTLALGIIIAVSMWAVAEIIGVLIALEENTRLTTALLQGQTSTPPPGR